MKTKVIVVSVIFLSASLFIQCSVVQVNANLEPRKVDSIRLTDYRSVQVRNKDVQNPNLALGVAISGGGSRAQYFGLGVMLGLEEVLSETGRSQAQYNFLNDVDYFSTVSGGGFAAGYYLTIKKHFMQDTGSFNRFWYSKRHTKYQESIRYNATPLNLILHWPREWGIMGRKFVRQVRRDLLQQGKSGINEVTLGDMFIPVDSIKTPVTLPMLVANGTIFNDAERLPFMPHIMPSLKIWRTKIPRKDLRLKGDSITRGYNIPLRFPIAASSAFPGVIPNVKFCVLPTAGTRKGKNLIRAVDGGIVDNLGYTTLFELLAADTTVANENKRALIIDCSGAGREDWYSENLIGFITTLQHSLFFTLQSKYEAADEDMLAQANENRISPKNYETIAITTLRSHVEDIVAEHRVNKSLPRNNEYERVLRMLEEAEGRKYMGFQKKWRWKRFYKCLDSLIGANEKEGLLTLRPSKDLSPEHSTRLDRIRTEDLGKLSHADVLLLYELASLVSTNVEIKKRQRAILILAGRYAVHLKKKRLQELYSRGLIQPAP